MSANELVGIAALVVSLLVAYVTLSPFRAELEVCKKERLQLRRDLQLVTAAIVGTLPREQRIRLLHQLYEQTEPREAA